MYLALLYCLKLLLGLALVGALVIAVIQFGLVFVDMDPFWQYLAVGMVIIIAVLIDQSKSHLSSRAS